MIGLTVRWSLAGAAADVVDKLKSYVRDESYTKFEKQPGLRHKSWRLVEGGWFEGSYTFATSQARAEFQAAFETVAATSAGSKIIGSAPILIEACDVLAVVEGPEGFLAASSM